MSEIVLECKPDEALLKALGYPVKRIVHQNNRGEVINYLKKNPQRILGIIDDDPDTAKPTFFGTFQRETIEKHKVESFIINKSSTRLIVIKPRLEDWVLFHAAQCKIDVTDYYLPTTSKKLHEEINSKLPRFTNLIKDMLSARCAGLMYLKSLISNF